MSDVIDVIRRIRKVKEDACRQELTRAEYARDVSEACLQSVTEAVEQAQQSCDPEDAGMMTHHHSYALKMEMNRRALKREVEIREQMVARKRGELVEAAVETKSIENVADARNELQAQEQAKSQQNVLDEFGSIGWWRTSA